MTPMRMLSAKQFHSSLSALYSFVVFITAQTAIYFRLAVHPTFDQNTRLPVLHKNSEQQSQQEQSVVILII